MERLSALPAALLAVIAGCSFSAHAPSNPGGDDTPGVDAAVPGDVAASIDGAAACVRGFLDLCTQAAPSTALDITNAQSINTGPSNTDPRCRTLTQPGGSDVCLIYATAVTITGNGSLTATGSRPLAIASSSTLTIDGALDVGSHGPQRGPAADAMGCTFATVPELDRGGGAGAAGGSLTQPGGDGGIGDSDNSVDPDGTAAAGTHGATIKITVLRGGCAGQAGGDEAPGGGANGGAGGHAGGALYLFARQSLTITGDVRATGAGGGGGQVQAGGGGGGTGGLVVIESPSITISGRVAANGGGGGQGGGRLNQNDISGNPGTDGAMGTTAAAGGSGVASGDPRFGFGGAGGATTAAVGGTTANFGGGGGGGAAGVIELIGTTQLSGSTISPAPQ